MKVVNCAMRKKLLEKKQIGHPGQVEFPIGPEAQVSHSSSTLLITISTSKFLAHR